MAEGRWHRAAPRQCAFGPRQRAPHRSGHAARSSQWHRCRATVGRNPKIILTVANPKDEQKGIPREIMTDRNFYWRHLRLPLILFALLAPLLATTSVDLVVARALFFDGSRWIGADSWWTNQLIHHDGALLIRSIAAATLILWASTWWRPQWRELRRPALY